ncbi:hypothetical protein AB0467_09375 [Streptomyces sp. NPDC052095]|uniref:hypothetical protein n=1 Tax=unclassified Streptomyces TaxID=2593676 RepID=UPI00344C9DD0
MRIPSWRTGVPLALAYLVAVFGLDYLSGERGSDLAGLVELVITFPSGIVTLILLLLLAAVFGFDDGSTGPDTYAPSVYAVSGIVQVLLVWLVLWVVKKQRAGKRREMAL